VVEKDMEIQEKEKLYTELNSVLERQPGPEVVEQLSIYEHTLKDKTRQLKAMASELSIFIIVFFFFSQVVEEPTDLRTAF
jgi:hypothetical protein